MKDLEPNVLRNISEINLSARETNKRQTIRDDGVVTAWMFGGCLYFISAVGAAVYLPDVVPAEWHGPVRCLTLLAVFAPFIAPFLSSND